MDARNGKKDARSVCPSRRRRESVIPSRAYFQANSNVQQMAAVAS